MQPRPFDEWFKEVYQRDANLCGVCARPTDESSLVRGEGEYFFLSFFLSFFLVNLLGYRQTKLLIPLRYGLFKIERGKAQKEGSKKKAHRRQSVRYRS